VLVRTALILQPELTRDRELKTRTTIFPNDTSFFIIYDLAKIQTSIYELVLIIQKSSARAMLIGYLVTRILTLGSQVNSGW
jgi:hypothetical protein